MALPLSGERLILKAEAGGGSYFPERRPHSRRRGLLGQKQPGRKAAWVPACVSLGEIPDPGAKILWH